MQKYEVISSNAFPKYNEYKDEEMEKFVINGGKRLSGEVSVSGNKNASLAVLAGVCLCDEP